MLVAGTALSLIAPVAAQASDTLDLKGINSYSRSKKTAPRFNSDTFVNDVNEEIATLKGRVDGLQAQQNNFEAGGFSDSTVMDGKAIFTVGAADFSEASQTDEGTYFNYTYTMNLNSSFTGDDNLYVRLKTGNASGWAASKTYGGYLSSTNTKNDVLTVDKIWYSFPLGDNNTIYVGPKIENYYMHGATPSIYKPITKQFTLGGNGNAYGASTDTGAGWAYKADNGFSVSSNIGTKSTTSKKVSGSYVNTGLLGNETKTSWATQVGYTKPRYSVSAIANIKSNAWVDEYYHTDAANNVYGDGNFTAIGLRGWWRPEETGTATPSISLGYDTTSSVANPGHENKSTSWFAGLTWQDMFQADDKIGIAFGQPTKHESESVDPFAYEAYYQIPINDSVTVTPAVFGGSNRNGTSGADITGYVIQTTFKF